jgi:hypothetical protein
MLLTVASALILGLGILVQPGWAVGGMVALVVVLLALRRLEVLFGMLLLASSISGQTMNQMRVTIENVDINPFDPACSIVAIAAWLRLLKFGATASFAYVAIGTYTANAFLSVVIAVLQGNRMYEVLQDLRTPLFLLAGLTAAVAVIRSREDLKRVLLVMLFVPLMLTAQQFWVTASAILQGDEILQYTVYYEYFRDASLPLLLVAGSTFFAFALHQSGLNLVRKNWLMLLIIANSAAMMLSLIRSVWLGLVGAAAALILVRKGRRTLLQLGLPLVFALVVFEVAASTGGFQGLLVGRATAAFSDDDPTRVGRFAEMQAVIRSLSGSWVFGQGMGATIEIDQEMDPASYFYGVRTTVNLHNGYMWYLLKGGLLWMGMICLGLFILFRRAYRTLMGSTDPLLRATALGCLLTLADIAASALTAATLSFPVYTGYVGLISGITIIISESPERFAERSLVAVPAAAAAPRMSFAFSQRLPVAPAGSSSPEPLH